MRQLRWEDIDLRSRTVRWIGELDKNRLEIVAPLLGFHGQKRAGVRRKEFRALPNPLREKLTGTSARTLDSVYDDVSVEEMRDALASLERADGRRTV